MPSLVVFACYALFLALLKSGSSEKLICEEYSPCRFSWEEIATVSDEELMRVSSELLRNDEHNAAKHIRPLYQSRALSKNIDDEAPKPLMTFKTNVFNLPSVTRMKMLFDNFNPDSAESENITMENTKEEMELIKYILVTNVMQTALDFLATNGIIINHKDAFFDILMGIWFLKFPRTAKDNPGSCAFESIFLAELVQDRILGMKNWIFFSFQEIKKTADYMGYKKIVNLGKRGAIVKLRYKWLDVMNPSGSMFMGTSPELEMALYTICFLTRPNKPCHLSLEGQNITIKMHSVVYKKLRYLEGVSFSI